MKLKDMAQQSYLKAFVYGPSGTGKTCFAAGAELPIEYHDFDNKVNSAASFFSSDEERLKQIEVISYASLDIKQRLKKFVERCYTLQKLQQDGKPLPFKTLVIDSLTTLTHYLLEDYIYVSQTGLKRPIAGINGMQDYQLLDKHATQIVTGLLSLNCNIIFIGHSQLEKDETTGTISNSILMPGKFSFKIPVFFEEVWFAGVKDGKYTLQTQSDARTICRTQRKLPKEVETKYASVAAR